MCYFAVHLCVFRFVLISTRGCALFTLIPFVQQECGDAFLRTQNSWTKKGIRNLSFVFTPTANQPSNQTRKFLFWRSRSLFSLQKHPSFACLCWSDCPIQTLLTTTVIFSIKVVRLYPLQIVLWMSNFYNTLIRRKQKNLDCWRHVSKHPSSRGPFLPSN